MRLYRKTILQTMGAIYQRWGGHYLGVARVKWDTGASTWLLYLGNRTYTAWE